MNWFKNLKIFKKIFFSFLIILIITTIIGISGIISLQKSNNINEGMYNKELTTVKYVEKLVVNLLTLDNYLKNKILSTDINEIKDYSEKIKKEKIDLLSNFQKVSELVYSPKNKELVIEFKANWPEFENSLDEVNNISDTINKKDLEKEYQQDRTLIKPKLDNLKRILANIEENKYKVSHNYYNQSQEIFNQSEFNLIIFVIIAIIISLIIAVYIGRTITQPVINIKDSLRKVSSGDLDVSISSSYNDETGDVIRDFNLMINSLKESKNFSESQNWLKDGLNKLSLQLSGDNSLSDITNKAVSFLADYISAASGVIYILEQNTQTLKLLGSYAFTERNNLSNTYKMGEGIIGQVALEKKPIILKNITREQKSISTGTVNEPPLSIFALPLIYESQLYGVVELSSFELFDKLKQEFMNESNRIIATAIYSTVQSDKVKDLLVIAEASQREAQQKAFEVQKMNAELEEQQQQLQQQSKQMQQTNALLEEQQQQLQQQTEELKQSNSMLELQKQQVQQQEEETRQMNTQLLKTQVDLDERANQLELSNKYKAEFLANMSHELRTPLNSVILLSQILTRNKKQNLSAEDIEKVKVINNAGNELLRLINDILDLSKIESGKATLDIREFDLREILDEQLQYFGSLATEKGLNFIVNNQFEGEKTLLVSDSQKISQILRNFLSNAFKFTKEGSISVTVGDSGDKSKPLKLSVKDSGIGVPKNKQNLIFQAFSQVDGSTSRVYGGTGLGLSIAVELAKMLKGEIKLESEENNGSTFSLIIPYIIENTEANNSEEISSNIAEKTPVENIIKQEHKVIQVKEDTIIKKIEDDRNNISTGDKVILIIEDDLDFANSVKYVNQDLNLKSIIAPNGKTGLELAFKFRPSGIILDMGLPDMNGIDVLQELKTTRELKHIPVHVISGNDRENFELQKKGALGFKQKPVSEDDLSSILTNMINFSEKKDKRVLVIEDNMQQLTAVTELIKDNDIDAFGVGTELEAKNEIDKGIYSLIIVDLGLKEGNGYDICHYIKEKNLNIPVIVYTGKQLTQKEENDLKKISDTIVIKTVHSGERLMDEISMFLHVVNQSDNSNYISKLNNIKKEVKIEGKIILIVDDDIKNTFVLAAALEEIKAEILTAKNGKEALEVIRSNPGIDLILMDIMMPVMNGYEAIEAIRADESIKSIPIIAATAKALKDDKAKCFEAGANDYITKPIDFDVLLNIVEKWIDKKV